MLAVQNKQAEPITQSSQRYMVVGDLMKMLVTRAESNDQFIIAETFIRPAGGMPLLHTHPSSETFYVLEGSFAIFRQNAEGQKIRSVLNAGEVAHIPGNAPHGFTNIGKNQGKLLIVLEGKSMMDEFFAEIGIPVEDETQLPAPAGSPDMAHILDVSKRYGIKFLEAPPG